MFYPLWKSKGTQNYGKSPGDGASEWRGRQAAMKRNRGEGFRKEAEGVQCRTTKVKNGGEQCCRLRKPKDLCSCALLGAWRIIQNRGRAEPAAQRCLHRQIPKRGWQRRRMKMMRFTPSTCLSLASKPVPRVEFCKASCSHPPLQNTHTAWGFRGLRGPWKPPLGCAPILSKHFKDITEVPCLSGSMSQSDKNWNKTPKTKTKGRGRQCCGAQRAEDVGTAGLNCLLPCSARRNVAGTVLLSFGLLLVGFF